MSRAMVTRLRWAVVGCILASGALAFDTNLIQVGLLGELEQGSTRPSALPRWMVGVESPTDSCAVRGNCLRSRGKGSCTIRIDPAKAEPLCSTTLSTHGKDALVVDGVSYESKGPVSPCNITPASDFKWMADSDQSAFNFCWRDSKTSVMRKSHGASVPLYTKCFWVNGLCWLWASPCSGMCSSVTLGNQHPGTLRYATEAEWNAAEPSFWSSRRAFYALCAASLLEHQYTHCDESDGWSRHGSPKSWSSDDLILIYEGFTGGPPMTTFSGAGPAIAAKGDPHLANVFGQRFDLYKVGVHRLLQVPLRAERSAALLSVDAEARQLGNRCGELYFTAVNVSGKWAKDGNEPYPIQYFADSVPQTAEKASSRKFGKVGIKVVWGHTHDGIAYLNVIVKHLKAVGMRVGGLLGEDDHTLVATPGATCAKDLLKL